jgi:hypothetical protein
MDIKRSGSQPSGKGQAESFAGNVRIDPLHKADELALIASANTVLKRKRSMTYVNYSISDIK